VKLRLHRDLARKSIAQPALLTFLASGAPHGRCCTIESACTNQNAALGADRFLLQAAVRHVIARQNASVIGDVKRLETISARNAHRSRRGNCSARHAIPRFLRAVDRNTASLAEPKFGANTIAPREPNGNAKTAFETGPLSVIASDDSDSYSQSGRASEGDEAGRKTLDSILPCGARGNVTISLKRYRLLFSSTEMDGRASNAAHQRQNGYAAPTTLAHQRPTTS
jgi:hypothetical protein